MSVVVDVALGASEKIIEADDVVAVGDQAIAQVRAEKSGAAGYQYGPGIVHVPP